MKSHTSSAQRRLLRKHGKSFWLASLFLPATVAADAAMLYAFCRTADDIADHAASEAGLARLEAIRAGLERGEANDAALSDFIDLARRKKIRIDAALFLIDTLLLDADGGLQIRSEDELVRYCYGAAGTVGLMMSPLLGVTRDAALPHAVDLGIAMQLTNIARDVAEDASLGRRYLPGMWTQALSPELIAQAAMAQGTASDARATIAAAVDRTLALADVFYASGALGLPAIPARARLGIEIAACLYREIGMQIRQRNCDIRLDRVVVPLRRKLAIIALVLIGRSPLQRLMEVSSRAAAHPSLTGLPGTA